jgi:hypothetical protein
LFGPSGARARDPQDDVAVALARSAHRSVEAFEAIARTLSLGSMGYEAEANERGERLRLEAAMADRLAGSRCESLNSLGGLVAQGGRLLHDLVKLFAQIGVRLRRREVVDLAFEVKKLCGQRTAQPDAGSAQFPERALDNASANCIRFDRFGITAFVDPSGGSAISMTMAIAHSEREIVVLDVTAHPACPLHARAPRPASTRHLHCLPHPQ